MGRKSNNQGQKGKKSGKVIDAAQLAKKVLNFLDNNYGKEFNAKQIIKKLEIRDSIAKGGVEPMLHKLAAAGNISKSPRNYFASVKEPEFIEGEVDFVNPRFAFIKPDAKHGLEEDVLIKEADLKHALDGDRVRIMVYPVKGSTGRLEGKVLEIVSRSRDEFVGRVEISPRFAFVVPDFKKMHYDIFVHRGDLGGAEHNQKVVVKLSDWREDDKNPTGKVTRVLGKAGEHEVEIHSIMAEFGLPFEYPQEVEDEANLIPEEISPEEIKNRRDMRDIPTFTIDPADAKDFDDAISYRVLENENLEIGVHIADVTHYVKPKTKLEKEAYERATSVYLVDRTIPMLPERLSNGLCSLRPNEDKLTFSCVFEMDENADVLNTWIGRTVTHSDRRFAYEEGQENIDKQEGDFYQELTLLNDLAKKLRGAVQAKDLKTLERLFQRSEVCDMDDRR